MTQVTKDATKDAAPEKQWPDNALTIESMDLEAQGVGHRADGKVVFVDGALPFEVVRANVHRKKTTGKKPRCWKCCTNRRSASRPVVPTLACTQGPAVAARCSTWMRLHKSRSSNAP
jgi:23S rRNA (uracil1939-C5)-methyltransferase